MQTSKKLNSQKSNVNGFTKFQKNEISRDQLMQLKGGDNIIIEELVVA